MNIAELKKEIADLPDDMLVGGSGYYGEYLKVNSVYKRKVSSKVGSSDEIDCLTINIEDAGEEPD